MVNRISIIITGILVAIAIAVALVDGRAKRDKRVGAPILDAKLLTVIDAITMEGEGQKASLKRTDGIWTIEKDGFPADPVRILRLLDSLAQTNLERVVAMNSEGFDELGMKAPRTLTLNSGNKTELILKLGNTRPGGGQYAAVTEAPPVYLLSANISVDTSDSAWETHSLTRFNSDQIKTISMLPPEGGTPLFRLSREKAGDPLKFVDDPAGEPNETAVTSLASGASRITFSKRLPTDNVEAKEALAHAPGLEVHLFDEATYMIRVGSTGDKEKTYFLGLTATAADNAPEPAKRSAQAASALGKMGAYQIDPGTATTLLRQKDDLIKK